jgi:hypothetical protein
MANDWFVAPNGTPAGDGSIGNPWNAETALGLYNGTAMVIQPSQLIQPGDAVWVRGGIHTPTTDNGFMCGLTSSDATKPVTVRNYNGERATFQCATQAFAFAIYGANVWYWGLEVQDSGAPRTANVAGSFGNPLSYGIAVYASGVKIINCIVHDTAQGLSCYNAASDMECHGLISYYNGWGASDRAHGHGMYVQNLNGTKDIENCTVFNNADEGCQIYGSGGADLSGITYRNNTLAQNGELALEGGGTFEYNLLLGGGVLDTGNTIDGNMFYFDPTDPQGHGYISIGIWDPSTAITCTNNVFVGGYEPFSCADAQGPNMVVTGNKVVSPATALSMVRLGIAAGGSLTGFTWDNNEYYGLEKFFQGTYDGSTDSYSGGYNTFAAWKAGTGFDTNSAFTPGLPTGKWIYVIPNKFEAKRASVTIYNWDLSATVDVDLSSILAVGDPFVIQDAQNFYGPAVVSGTYAGGTVAIPMTGLVKAAPIGIATPAHTAPMLGTFIVMPPGPAIPIPQPTPNPTPTPVPNPTPVPTPTPGGTVFTTGQRVEVNTTSLNVRTLPNATLPAIGNVVKPDLGTVLAGIDTTNTFTNVAFDNGITGYVLTAQLLASTTPPPTPTTTHSASLTWVASPDADAGYNVYRNGVKIATVTALTYVDHTVVAGITYTYYVTTAASSTGSESVPSNTVSAAIPSNPTPPPPTPPATQHTPPSGLTVSVA